jgi:cell division protein FtsI/penicillin-binding protein 2
MVEIVKKVGKEIFYNYLSKFRFGKLTGIELAEEKAGFIDNETTVSSARFLNNSFGQGLQVTQIQLAAAYGALINGGEYIQPTIVSHIGTEETNSKILGQIIRPEVSEEIKSSLRAVVERNNQYRDSRIEKTPGGETYHLGAKSGTAQIAFR